MAKLAVAFVSCLLCTCCAFAQQTPESALDKVRSSVVKIEIVIHPTVPLTSPVDSQPLPDCFQGQVSCIAGTGIVVSSTGDVITASHVATESIHLINALQGRRIAADLEVGISVPNIENAHLTFGANTSRVRVEIKAIDQLHDLALLHAPILPVPHELLRFRDQSIMSPAWPAPIRFGSERASDAEPIFACGFPLGEPALVTTEGSIASAWSNETVLTAQNLRDATPIEVYKLNLQSTFGNSGGPIFRSSDQAVVGIIIEMSKIPGGAPTAVPSKYITAFLTEQGVPWQTAKKK